MELAKPQKYITRVVEKYYLTDNEKYLLVKLELTQQNNTLSFVAGQYVSIKVSEQGERRSYSIASTPDIDHAVSLVVELLPGGKGSEFLKNIPIGAEVEMLAPMGRFVVESSQKLLFVATGSGIAPIMAMINDELINKHNSNQMRLHWGMRSEEELFWLDNLGRLAEAHPNFVFDLVLSRPSEQWELCRGHVQDCITRDMQGVLDVGWEAYLCGNPKMVEENQALLNQLGMNNELIHFERFS